MSKKMPYFIPSFMMGALILMFQGQAAEPMATSFMYQGELKRVGVPVSDAADFNFSLWDAETGGLIKGTPVELNNVMVQDGLFMVDLDFGVEVFDGQARWLEIIVRCPAVTGPVTLLSPRQPLRATPYSLQTRGIVVNDEGKVGIGQVSNPASILEVSRVNDTVARFTTTFDNNGPRLLLRNMDYLNSINYNLGSVEFTDKNNKFAGGMLYRRTLLGDRLAFIAGEQEYMVIGQDGRVGIGTGTAFARLHIANVGPVVLLLQADVDNANEIDNARVVMTQDGGEVVGRVGYRESEDVFEIMQEFSDKLVLGTNNEDRLTITAAGDVGIGTVSPAAKLDVAGGIKVSNSLSVGGNATFSGNATINGQAILGYQIVVTDTYNTRIGTATCPAGMRVIGGGCSYGVGALRSSSPEGNTGWYCFYESSDENDPVRVHAICARIQ